VRQDVLSAVEKDEARLQGLKESEYLKRKKESLNDCYRQPPELIKALLISWIGNFKTVLNRPKVSIKNRHHRGRAPLNPMPPMHIAGCGNFSVCVNGLW
jgi:hypothetical protein